MEHSTGSPSRDDLCNTCEEFDNEEAQRRLQEEYDFYYSRRLASGASSRSPSPPLPSSPMKVEGDYLAREVTPRCTPHSISDEEFIRQPSRSSERAALPRFNPRLRHDRPALISPSHEDEEVYLRRQRYHHTAALREGFLEGNTPPRHDLYAPNLYANHVRIGTAQSSTSRLRSSPCTSLKMPPLPPPLTQHSPPSPDRKPAAVTLPAARSNKTLEISPGVHVPFRGAEETWHAVQRDFYVPCQCYGCGLEDGSHPEPIFCIQDAAFVVCALCKTVSPLDGGMGEESNDAWGVGLGFTLATLAALQEDCRQL
jgi:hypothetical protein